MMAPHELKNKAFQKEFRGYNVSEVDEYINFLLEKYTEVYRENNELQSKLKTVASKLEEISDEENAIRSTLSNAQKIGEQIVHDAQKRADDIALGLKERCKTVLDDFQQQIAQSKDEMWEIRTRVLEFKKRVFDLYRVHIDELKSISVNEFDEIVLPEERQVIESIFADMSKAFVDTTESETEEKEPEIAVPSDIKSDTAEDNSDDNK